MNSFIKSLLMSSCVSSIFAANTLVNYPDEFRQGLRNTIVVGMYPTLVESVKSGDIVDYRHSRVSDLECSNTISVLKVLRDIRDSVLGSPYNPTNIVVNLSENDITANGFRQLVSFLITDDQTFASRIKHLDLSNNRIDPKAKDDVLQLLRRYTSLTLDLSINYLDLSELCDMEESVRSRIIIRNY
jgi:hypothetical protein